MQAWNATFRAGWVEFFLAPSLWWTKCIYTSSVFIWLCFFWRKFLWEWLQFIFILITLLWRKKRHKSQDFSIQHLTIDVMPKSPKKGQKTCKWDVFISLTCQEMIGLMDSRISMSCSSTLQEDSDWCRCWTHISQTGCWVVSLAKIHSNVGKKCENIPQTSNSYTQ